MAVDDAHVFPGFLIPVLTQLSFQSLPLLFSHALAEVIAGKKVRHNWVSNSQPLGRESDMLATRAGRYQHCLPLQNVFKFFLWFVNT